MVRYGIRDWYTTAGRCGPSTQQSQVECGCCSIMCDPQNTVACPSKHAFCIECVQRYAASQLGEHKADIPCMHTSGCKVPFHTSTLQRILSPQLLKLRGRLQQQAELRAANIPNLESCPRCDFAMIMDVSPDQVPLFQCLNTDPGAEGEGCGRVTCRACKRDSHWPRTCREEEIRCMGPGHAVEEAMSEALMRRCPRCQRPSIKENGCNHIRCPDCQTHFCYHCRKNITAEGYGHFHRNVEHDPRTAAGANGKCLMWDEVRLEDQHNREVQIARERATAQQLDHARRAHSANRQPAAGPSRANAVSNVGPGTSASAPLHRRQAPAPVQVEPRNDAAYLAQQGQALFQRLFGAQFQPAVPPPQLVQAVFPHPPHAQPRFVPAPIAPQAEPNPRPEPEIEVEVEIEDENQEIDLAGLSRAVDDASHALKLARRRESYARKQWGARHRLWSQERYDGVVRETGVYSRALSEAERHYQEGRRVKAEQDAINRQERPARHVRVLEHAVHVNVLREVAEPMVVDPPEEVGTAQLAVDIGALRGELGRAQHELTKARRRESYAKKQWDARHRLWSQERYDGVVRETEVYARDVKRVERMLREAAAGRAGR